MANELSVYYPVASLSTIYFVVTTDSTSWNSSGVAGSDSGTPMTYVANFPGGIAHGTVNVFGYRQLGGSKASTDTLIGTQLGVNWDGTNLSSVGTGTNFTPSGTTIANIVNSGLWLAIERLISANSFNPTVQSYLRMARLGQSDRFWTAFEQVAGSYFGGLPVNAADAATRLADFATTLNAWGQVANELVALANANTGTLATTINPSKTGTTTVRTFP